VTIEQRLLDAFASVGLPLFRRPAFVSPRPAFGYPQGRTQWWRLSACAPPLPAGSIHNTPSILLLLPPTVSSALAFVVLLPGLVAALLPVSFLKWLDVLLMHVGCLRTGGESSLQPTRCRVVTSSAVP
jgi:hypothetical protein